FHGLFAAEYAFSERGWLRRWRVADGQLQRFQAVPDFLKRIPGRARPMHARPALELTLGLLGSIIGFEIGEGFEVGADIVVHARLGFGVKLSLRFFQEL